MQHPTIRRLGVGLAAVVILTLGLIGIRPAGALAPNTPLTLFKGANCTVTASYGQAFGVVPVDKFNGNLADCGPSYVILVYADSNNVLHDTGQCPLSWTGPPCSWTPDPGGASGTEQATGPNYNTAFGIKIHLCGKAFNPTRWDCVDRAYSAFTNP